LVVFRREEEELKSRKEEERKSPKEEELKNCRVIPGAPPFAAREGNPGAELLTNTGDVAPPGSPSLASLAGDDKRWYFTVPCH
jgi:hypothetical protein